MASAYPITRPKTPRPSRAQRFIHIASLFEPQNEEPPYTIEPWHAVEAVRPDTAHVRALRFLDTAGEMLGALILIIGGIGFTGIASLVGGA